MHVNHKFSISTFLCPLQFCFKMVNTVFVSSSCVLCLMVFCVTRKVVYIPVKSATFPFYVMMLYISCVFVINLGCFNVISQVHRERHYCKLMKNSCFTFPTSLYRTYFLCSSYILFFTLNAIYIIMIYLLAWHETGDSCWRRPNIWYYRLSIFELRKAKFWLGYRTSIINRTIMV